MGSLTEEQIKEKLEELRAREKKIKGEIKELNSQLRRNLLRQWDELLLKHRFPENEEDEVKVEAK